MAENTSVGPNIMDNATAPFGLNAVSPRRLPYFTIRDTAPESSRVVIVAEENVRLQAYRQQEG